MIKIFRPAVVISIAILIALPNLSLADVSGCGCYCGKVLPPPCSDEACKSACGWQGSSGGGGGYSGPSQEEIEREREEQERIRLEQERVRRQEIEEHQKKEEEEAKKRQEEFEQKKEETLREMKGISEGELGLKGTGEGDLGLKGTGSGGAGGMGLKGMTTPANAAQSKKPACEWGNLGPSVVDLRCLGLDPDKPITVDWHVVQGRERVFPAQVDPRTFENVNYKRGIEAEMHFDIASAARAVRYFKLAQRQRPNDPLVRNALLLAQDIYKERRQRQKNDQEKAAYLTIQSYVALMAGENGKARGFVSDALKLDPDNNNAKFVESFAKTEPGGGSSAQKNAYKLVANGLVCIHRKDYAGAMAMLTAARHLQPEDKFIGAFLDEMQKAVK